MNYRRANRSNDVTGIRISVISFCFVSFAEDWSWLVWEGGWPISVHVFGCSKGQPGARFTDMPSRAPEACGHHLFAPVAASGWERQKQERGTLRFRSNEVSAPKTSYNKNSVKQGTEEPVTRKNNQWQQAQRHERSRASICKNGRGWWASSPTPPPASWDALSNFKRLDTIRSGYFQHIPQDICSSKVELKILKAIWSLPNTCESDNAPASPFLKAQMSLNLLGILAVYHLDW